MLEARENRTQLPASIARTETQSGRAHGLLPITKWLATLLLLAVCLQAPVMAQWWSKELPPDSPAWWTLSDDLSAGDLQAQWALLIETSRSHRASTPDGEGPQMVTLRVDGSQTPELIPFWRAFQLLAVALDDGRVSPREVKTELERRGVGPDDADTIVWVAKSALELEWRLKLETTEDAERFTKVIQDDPALSLQDFAWDAPRTKADRLAVLSARTEDANSSLPKLFESWLREPALEAGVWAALELRDRLSPRAFEALRHELAANWATSVTVLGITRGVAIDLISFETPVFASLDNSIFQGGVTGAVQWNSPVSPGDSILVQCMANDSHCETGGSCPDPLDEWGFGASDHFDNGTHARIRQKGQIVKCPGANVSFSTCTESGGDVEWKGRLGVAANAFTWDPSASIFHVDSPNLFVECVQFLDVVGEAEMPPGAFFQMRLKASDSGGGPFNSDYQAEQTVTGQEYTFLEAVPTDANVELTITATADGFVCGFATSGSRLTGRSSPNLDEPFEVPEDVICECDAEKADCGDASRVGLTATFDESIPAGNQRATAVLSVTHASTGTITISKSLTGSVENWEFGSFAPGTSFSVVLEDVNQNILCSVDPIQGVIESAAVLINVECIPGSVGQETYAIKGTASIGEIAGAQPSVRLELKMESPEPNGSSLESSLEFSGSGVTPFVFDGVPDGWSYDFDFVGSVGSVGSDVFSMDCSLSKSSGVINGADITGVDLTCTLSEEPGMCDPGAGSCSPCDLEPLTCAYAQGCFIEAWIPVGEFTYETYVPDWDSATNTLTNTITTHVVTVWEAKLACGSEGSSPALLIDGPLLALKEPFSTGDHVDNLPVSGFASDLAGIRELRFRIDGAAVVPSQLLVNQYDSDACGSWSDPGCDGQNGFSGILPVDHLAAGEHVLRVTAVSNTEPAGITVVDVPFQKFVPPSPGCTTDVDEPQVSILEPVGLSVEPGYTLFQATFSDDSGLRQTRLIHDGSVIAEGVNAPSLEALFSGVAGTTVLLRAEAEDTCGNIGFAEKQVSITEGDPCVGDTTGPTITLSSPLAVSPGAQVESSAQAPGDTERVSFALNGLFIGLDTTAPFSKQWTAPTAVGDHVISATAWDACDNQGPPAEVTFEVSEGSGGCSGDTDPPAISLTSPAAPPAEPTATVGEPYTLSASLGADPNGIASVTFSVRQGIGSWQVVGPSSVLGSQASATWTPAAQGSYSVRVSVTDGCGNSATSASHSLLVDAVSACASDFTPPATVSLLTPLAGASILPSEPFSWTASASSDTEAVELWSDGSLLGVGSGPPWAGTATLAQGSYSLRARAYDECGNSRDSAAVSVTVASCSPTGSISSPLDNATVEPGAVTLTGRAIDGSGIENVRFRINGSSVGTQAFDPAVTTADASITWNAVAEGTYTLTMEADPVCGLAVQVADISFTVDAGDPCAGDTTGPALVELTEPSTGDELIPGETFAMRANASSDTDRIQFRRGATILSTDEQPPWQTFHDFVDPGTYRLKARAFDACGNKTDSADVEIVVSNCTSSCPCPTGSISQPAPNAILQRGQIWLEANAQHASGIENLRFVVDGTQVGVKPFLPPTTSVNGGIWWNASGWATGPHELHVLADSVCGPALEIGALSFTLE